MKIYLHTVIMMALSMQSVTGFLSGSSLAVATKKQQHQQHQQQLLSKWRLYSTGIPNTKRPSENHHPRLTLTALSASFQQTSNDLSKNQHNNIKALLSASLFFVMDSTARRLFQRWNLIQVFPPSLAACALLFVAQISILNPTLINNVLQPGALLFAKWLPVFFVPSLITLPLANTQQLELVKMTIIVSVGFLVSLLSTAASVVLVRRKVVSENPFPNEPQQGSSTIVSSQPFSNRLVQILTALTLVSGINAITFAQERGQTIYLVLATLTSFVHGSQLPCRIKSIFHPLVTCTVLTWAAIQCLAVPTLGVNSFYAGLRLYQTTAGSILLKCLGPAVVSLACSMYTRRMLMRDNWRSILVAIGTSTITGLLGTAVAVRWLSQTSAAIRLSLLSRNITSPLAMAIAKLLQADVSLAVSMVVVTGLLGANFGGTILSAVGIRDPVARGLAVGAAAHGLGTAAMVNEKEAFPFAGAAMALSAFAATITVSIPAVRHFLLRIAMG